MTAVFVIVDNSITTKETIVGEDREFLQVENALQRIAIDFNQMYNPLFFSGPYSQAELDLMTGEDGGGLPDFIASFSPTEKWVQVTREGHLIPYTDMPDRESFVFMTKSNRRKFENSKQSQYAWVSYFVRDSDPPPEGEKLRASKELVRQYSAVDPYSPTFNWDDVKTHILLKNLKDFDFKFWDRERKKYVDSPRELGKDKGLVRSLKIELTWIDATNSEIEMERTYRTLWPFFDTTQDAKDRLPSKNTNQENSEDS